MAAKRVISIEAGEQKTRLCVMDYRKKNPRVYKCIVFDTPEYTVEDGYIRDKDNFVAQLRSILNKNRIKVNDVVFTISSTKIANREVTIPLVKKKKIQAVIDAGAQDYFPVDVSDYSISYTMIEKLETQENKKYKLLLIAAPNSLIKNYYSIASMLGLHVEAIDYSGNSFFQLAHRQVNESLNLALYIDEGTTVIDVIDNHKLMFRRIVSYGFKQVAIEIVDNEIFEPKTEKEAFEFLCREYIINDWLDADKTSNSPTFNEDTEEKLILERRGKEEVTESLRYIIGNISRVLDFYNSKSENRKIQAVYICGPGSRMNGVIRLLHNELGLKINRIEKFQGVSVNKKIDMTGIYLMEMATCLGAPIQPIGFVLPEMLAKKEKQSSLLGIKVILALSAVLSVCLIITSNMKVKTLNKENQDLSARVSEKDYLNEELNAYYNTVAEHASVTDLYQMTRSQNEKLNELIQKLEKSFPVNMKAISFNSSDEGVSFSILSTDKISAAELLKQLKEIENVDEVTIPSIVENEDDSGIITVSFTVNMKYRPLEDADEKQEE